MKPEVIPFIPGVWGMESPDEEMFILVPTGKIQGCELDIHSCRHNSHDPVAPLYNLFYRHAGDIGYPMTLVRRDSSPNESEEYEYYQLLNGKVLKITFSLFRYTQAEVLGSLPSFEEPTEEQYVAALPLQPRTPRVLSHHSQRPGRHLGDRPAVKGA